MTSTWSLSNKEMQKLSCNLKLWQRPGQKTLTLLFLSIGLTNLSLWVLWNDVMHFSHSSISYWGWIECQASTSPDLKKLGTLFATSEHRTCFLWWRKEQVYHRSSATRWDVQVYIWCSVGFLLCVKCVRSGAMQISICIFQHRNGATSSHCVLS